MFCGCLFIQAIGVGSNHVAGQVSVTLDKTKLRRRHSIAMMLLASPAMAMT
jgi:fucose permease